MRRLSLWDTNQIICCLLKFNSFYKNVPKKYKIIIFFIKVVFNSVETKTLSKFKCFNDLKTQFVEGCAEPVKEINKLQKLVSKCDFCIHSTLDYPW